jgi:hypothetical protein
LGARYQVESLLDLACILLQFLTQNRPIDFELVYDTMTFFITRQPEVVDPEFLFDIPLKVSDIIEVLLLFVYNDEFLKRNLQNQSR